MNLHTGIQVYAITPSYTAITILLDTVFFLSISYMVVVKQIAPVGFPTGACLLKRLIGQKVCVKTLITLDIY